MEWVPYGRTVQTIAFALVALATFISMGTQHDIYSDVVTTKFVKLNLTSDEYIPPDRKGFKASGDKTRVTALGLYTTQAVIHELRYKWRCPSDQQPADIWGPDSMCRCLDSYVKPISESKDKDAEMYLVEEACSKDVVPVYSKVYAGSIRGYWNFYVGIIMLHISILYSMKSVEYNREDYDINEPERPYKSTPYSRRLVEKDRDAILTKAGKQYAATRIQRVRRDQVARRSPKETPDEKDFFLDAPEAHQTQRFSLAAAFDWTRDVDTDDNIYMQVGNPTTQTWQSAIHVLWDTLIVFLCILVVIFVSLLIDDKNDLVKFKIGGTSTVLYIWSLVVALVTGLSVGYNYLGWFMSMYRTRRVNSQPVQEGGDVDPTSAQQPDAKEDVVTQSEGRRLVHYIYLCVMQDLNYITAFMLIVSTFSAQSGEHDDYTIFLDVACVLLIGFMQHLSHLSMLLKEEAIGLCEDQIDKQQALLQTSRMASDARAAQLSGHTASPDKTDEIRTPTYEAKMMDYIFQFFSTTRVFIFIVIGLAVYVFYIRIGPTVFGQNSVQSWNNSAKIYTLLFFISPSILYDLYYELVHFDHMRRYQRHLQYFGPQIWRIWGGIGLIAVFWIMTLEGYGGDNNMNYGVDVFLGGIRPSSH
jgi:hypothetical protein